MKKVYNKLVRDNIPMIIEKDTKTCIIRILNDEEYITALKNKLQEEVNELLEEKDKDSIKLEIADILEVLDAIEEFYEIDFTEVLAKKTIKAKINGRFEKRIFLESVEE